MAHNLNKRFSSRREKTPSYFTFMFVGFTLFGNDPTLCVCIFIALSIELNIYVFNIHQVTREEVCLGQERDSSEMEMYHKPCMYIVQGV